MALPRCRSKVAETELTFSRFANVWIFFKGKIFLLIKITIKISRNTDKKFKMNPEFNKNYYLSKTRGDRLEFCKYFFIVSGILLWPLLFHYTFTCLSMSTSITYEYKTVIVCLWIVFIKNTLSLYKADPLMPGHII